MDFEIEMRSEEHNKSQEFIRIGTFRSMFMCVYVCISRNRISQLEIRRN